MVKRDSSLPDWAEERLPPPGDELHTDPPSLKDTAETVFETVENEQRAWVPTRKVQAEVDVNKSRDTILNRLGTLSECGILNEKRIRKTSIWYPTHELTDWPVPPDVVVGPEPDEPTVTQWRSRSEVQVAALSIFAAVLGSVLLWLWALASTGTIDSFMSASDLLFWALSASLFSYLGLLFAGLLWVFDVQSRVESLAEWACEKRS